MNWEENCVQTINRANLSYNVATLKGFECVFRNILTVVGQFAILALFLMLVFGGFKYMTAGGDSKATEAAQKTLTAAITGLVLLVGIWLLLRFLSVFFGIDLLTFIIPISP
jgi:TRAP-type C4-dicarboxylate transport system permease small subunit